MEKESVSRFFHDLKESKTICLLGHASPDGDCIGSAFALYEYLIRQENEKEITIALDGKIPYNYDSYIDKSLITSVPDSKIYDMIITFDCANENRFGCFAGILSRGRKTVCIDHHDTNTNFADINFVDEKASSTGELLYRMLKLEKEQINQKMAEYIYISIMTDTGKFTYATTSSEAHIAAAELISIGIDVAKISNDIYYSKPAGLVKAYVASTVNLSLFYNNRLGIVKVTKEAASYNNNKIDEIDNIVELIREIRGLEISCVLKEYDNHLTKVSLRSKNNIDVTEISKKYHGGGHIRAAGFLIDQSIDDSLDIIVKEFKHILSGK